MTKNEHAANWTQGAIECYERGYDCVGCPTQQLLSDKCRMKESVLNLIQTIGLPPKDDDLFPDFKNTPLKIMKAIYNGAETLDELALELGNSISGIKTRLSEEIFPYYENKGFLRPTKNAFPAFIDFFKEFNEQTKNKDNSHSEDSSISSPKNPPEEQEDTSFALNVPAVEASSASPSQSARSFSMTNYKEKKMFDEDLKLQYADYLKPLVEAVKRGFESYDDLVRESGLTKHQISVYWANLLNPLILQGLIVRNQQKTQKQEVIDFVRNRLIDFQNGNTTKIEKTPQLRGKIEIKTNRHSEPEAKNPLCHSEPNDILRVKNLLQNRSFANAQDDKVNCHSEPESILSPKNLNASKDLNPLTEMDQTVLNFLLQGLNYQQITNVLSQ